MQRRFVINLVLIICINLLVKPLAIFGIDATVQNRVGTEAYGIYYTLLNLSFLFNILLDIGINNFTTRQVSQHPVTAASYAGRMLPLRFVLFLLYALVTVIFAVSIGFKGEQMIWLSWLIVNQLLVTLISYCRSHLGGLHLFRTDALISVLDRMLLILIAGYLLFIQSYPLQIFDFIWLQTICYAVTLILAVVFVLRHTGKPVVRWNPNFSYVVLKKSFPYALLVFLMMAYTRVDVIMLDRLRNDGAYQAGIYAQGYRLLDACYMFGMIFANVMFPLFARLIKQKSTETKEYLRLGRMLLCGGALLLALVTCYHSEWLLATIYTKDIAQSAQVLPWLMWAFCGMTFTLIYGTYLTAAGNLVFLNRLSASTIVVSILLNVLLIPKFGAKGAAWAACGTQVFVGVTQALYVHLRLRFSLTIRDILLPLSIILTIIISNALHLKENAVILTQVTIGIMLILVISVSKNDNWKKLFGRNK